MSNHPFSKYITMEKELPDRTLLIKEGSQNGHIFLILDGQVKVKKKTEKGDITLETLKAGSIIGEMSLLEQMGHFRGASVVTEGLVRIGIVNKKKLVQELEGLSPQWRDLLQSLFISLQKENERASFVAQSLIG